MNEQQDKTNTGMDERGDNRVTVRQLLLIIAGSFVFGVFVLPPLYDVICEVTGLNGTVNSVPKQVTENVQENREVKVEFLVSTQGQWEFTRPVPSMVVKPGKMYGADFFAKNLTGSSQVAQAVPSVSPSIAARYFIKTECFCFDQQSFAAGEAKDMPVRFVVDPDLPEDIETITLSYTFYSINQVASRD
ncbi:MAG: cytochrome c oxidase assembly protein [Gammaproteobacteria bacterium]|nr:cytochrome c oxidase assembly protein [Gammaproteobacteria bacterium]